LIQFELRPTPHGFWLLVTALAGTHYRVSYFALGPRGHHRTGELFGRTKGELTRRFARLPFLAMRVGLTRLQISEFSIESLAERSLPQVETEPPGIHLFESSLGGPFEG